MNTQRGRRLAGGRGNGGADLERKHSISTVPQAHDSHTTTSAPSVESAATGTDAEPSASHLLYTVCDAARLLSVSPAHLYRELQRGAIESVLAGGRCRRISRAALERYVARLEAEEEGGAR